MGEEPEEERVMLTKLNKNHRGQGMIQREQEESWECMVSGLGLDIEQRDSLSRLAYIK